MNLGESPGLAAVPTGHRLEVQGLTGRVRGHAKRPAADQCLRFREPHVLARGGYDLLVDQPERPEPDQGEEIAGSLREQNLEGVVVDRREAAQLRRLAGGDVAVARDDLEQPREIALARDRAIPAVDDVAGRYRIAVGEVRVVPQMKDVRQAVGGDGWLAGRDVGNLMQRRVESIQAGEDVAQDVDVGRA